MAQIIATLDTAPYDEGRRAAGGGSRQIRLSGVLPGLAQALVEEALERWSKTGAEGPTQTEDDTTLMGWLMETQA